MMDRPSQGTPDRGYERNIILGGKVSLLTMSLLLVVVMVVREIRHPVR